ncbi:hypothetical protein Tco_1469508 [Tanacetum coccineum]
MSKSKIMGILVADDNVKSATAKLGCFMLNTPFSYLGTKVGGSMSRTQAWEEVIDKVKARLSKWKMKTLSIGDLSSKKATWVKWDSVLASKEKGGLGVSSLYALNRALMFKWVWRFYSQNSSLWARVIKAVHGEDGKVGKDMKVGNQSCWLSIDDNWIGGNILKDLYPRIYAFDNCKNVSVSSKLADINLDVSWIWTLEGSREFFVASIRKAIDNKRISNVDSKTR